MYLTVKLVYFSVTPFFSSKLQSSSMEGGIMPVDAKELFSSLIFDVSPNISSELYFYLYNDDRTEEDYYALEFLLRYNF